MTTALAERQTDTPTVTQEQLTLIKQTVAQGATDAELKLFLFDCARQGVHPLDRLVHFTKRSGKYTPITSIDFMRIRAAETGEMAGSDDPDFVIEEAGPPVSATVTVYRLTQGQRFAYTATARWSEYKPEQNDFMWRKMPATMLGKCAEALALRKGFPRQLAGLYAKEEMEQAGEDKPAYVVEPPAGALAQKEVLDQNGLHPVLTPMPEGAVAIERVELHDTKNPNVKKCLITVSTGETYSTINTPFAVLAEQCCQDKTPVYLDGKKTKWGLDLTALTKAPTVAELEATKFQYPEVATTPPLTKDEIPF